MGEAKRNREQTQDKLRACAGAQTPAGKVHVRWHGAVTPQGQLAYFIELFHPTGLRAHWRDSCPLRDTSVNAPGKSDVLGAWLLSILAGHRRYAHITAMGGGGVNPALLGISTIISEDVLQWALSAMPATEGITRLDAHVRDSAWPLPDAYWVLRRPLAGELLMARTDCDEQRWLGFIEADRAASKRIMGYEYAVLVTNTAHAVVSLRQFYRDRANAENVFDELKNQWGWGVFTTHDARRATCQRGRWHWPVTGGVFSCGWRIRGRGSGHTTFTLCGLAAHAEQAKAALMQVSARLRAWAKRTAAQFTTQTVWRCVCGHASKRWSLSARQIHA